MASIDTDEVELIAIIGMSGRFPGAANITELWRNLRDGVESVRTFTNEELRTAGIDPQLLDDPRYVKAGTLLEGVDKFDARFFGLTPREAELTDPQHRLFLECAYEALENAGYNPYAYRGLIGVYAACAMSTYLTEHLHRNPAFLRRVDPLQIQVGNDKDFLPTRVSYKLNLRGPSVNVQTACSSSLVAVHMACQGLLDGACDLALAGGVSIRFPHPAGYLYQQDSILSPDGHCRAFDASAQGTVGGHGLGIVVLKRLSEAIADRDTVIAVIRGSAINNDGSLKVGYTAPSIEGQAEVIAAAHAMAAVTPESITYVEAHGTGTPLGDPIEMAALTQVFGGSGSARSCAIGSVKTNLGHLDAAAGVTGLIKTALQLRHREIVPSLHYREPNPKIDFTHSRFFVNDTLTAWAPSREPLRAGVSSFGIGGTNAHVILEEAPLPEIRSERPGRHLLVLSAKTQTALDTATQQLARHLRDNRDSLSDVAYTLQVGRAEHLHRRAVIGRTRDELVAALDGVDAKRTWTGKANESASAVFMFPGQGAQYAGMGKELYDTEPVFRAELDRSSTLLNHHLGHDIRHLIFAEGADASSRLQETQFTQPALFAVEYALARLWMSWGVQPAAMVGHSVGEFVAACIAGVFSLEDALRLIAFRGKAMQRLPPGAMVSVALGEQELQPMLSGELAIAAVNAPQLSVVSGPAHEVAAIVERLTHAGISVKPLRTSHAFHSPMMAPAADACVQEFRSTVLNVPTIPYLSNVTGRWIEPGQATDPLYWANHLLRPVRFRDAVSELLNNQNHIFIEVGPGATLGTLVRKQVKPGATTILPSLPAADEQTFGLARESLARAWVAGARVAWARLHGADSGGRVPLPSYPFDRERFWVEPITSVPAVQEDGARLPIESWLNIPTWERSAIAPAEVVDGASGPWLIFADRGRTCAELRSVLVSAGCDVTCVYAADTFSRTAASEYHVNPTDPADYAELLGRLGDAGRVPRHIVHLWSAFAGTDGLTHAFHSIVALLKAIAPSHREGVTISVVTNGACEVLGDESLRPEVATVLGLVRSARLEYPSIQCRVIDVDTSAFRFGVERLISESLMASSDIVVAYRGRHRWIPVYRRLSASTAARGCGPKPGGTYLIVGGFGNIGRQLARQLAKLPDVKLILVSRSVPKATAVREIEALGAQVLALQGDGTSPADMARVLEMAEARFGPVNGVIHAAGIQVVRTIQDITREECEQQLAAKLSALRALETALGSRELDFCMVVSSLSAVLGVYGFGAYAAAHSAADVFVQKHNQTHSSRWFAVDLDNWLIDVEPSAKGAPGGLEHSMTTDEGNETFQRIFRLTGIPQIAVSTADLQARSVRPVSPRAAAPIGSINGDGAPEHGRPSLDTPYLAPRTEEERVLAGIWEQLLGVSGIGVLDNFFELGGDSVMSIQIVARANQKGLRLTAKQVFEHKTIAELAAVVGAAASRPAEQGPVHGELPLTPIQRWFFEQDVVNPDHFNQAFVFEVPADISADLLAAALDVLAAHHDALRLRFERTSGGWQQYNAPAECASRLTRVDLTDVPGPEQADRLQHVAARLHRELDLSEGPLFRAAWFNFGPRQRGRLLIVVHHLAVDLVSWRILLEDLQLVYTQLRKGEQPRLAPKTTSFREWARHLNDQARAHVYAPDFAYWNADARSRVSRLPRELRKFDGAALEASVLKVSVALDANETRALLHDVPPVYNTQITDALLAALVMTFSKWTRERSLLVDLEGLGRESSDDAIDLSRTVGWFTTLYPVLLELPASDETGEVLMAVKEQLRKVPNRGLSYGVLRYLSDEPNVTAALRSLPPAEVSFLYQGQTSLVPTVPGLLEAIAGESAGDGHSPEARLTHRLTIHGYLSDGRLSFDWLFSGDEYRIETVSDLAKNYADGLRTIIRHCRSSKAGGVTPSDFAAARISDKDFDSLLGKLRAVSGAKR